MRRPPPALVLALVIPFAAVLLKGELPVSDAGLFEYYGRAIAHGSRLYTDLWDNKLPGIYVVNAAWQLLFGERYVLHALAEAAVVAASVALFAFVSVRNGIRAWAPAALAFALVVSILPTSFDSVENFALPCILLAYACGQGRRYVGAGIALAVATTFWLPAVLMLVPLLDRERERRARLVLIASAAGALVAYVALLLAVFGPSTLAELARSWVPYAAASFGGRAGAAGRLGALAPVLSGLGTSGAGVLLAVLLAVMRKPRDVVQRFGLVWTACALLGALALGNFYPHYFIPLLPACIFAIAAFGIDRRVTVRRAAFAAVALFFAWRTLTWEARVGPLIPRDVHDKYLAGERVRALAGPRAVIEVDPYEPGIFLAAGAAVEDRFGMIPPRIRPAARPGRAAPVVLVRQDRGADAPPDPSAALCERVRGWTIYVTRAGGAALAARCRAGAGVSSR